MLIHHCKVCKNAASYQLGYVKTGNKKPVSSFAILLKNELNSDVARFTNHLRTYLATNQAARILLPYVGGKTCNIAIQLVLKLIRKTRCTFFVTCFTVP